MNNEEIKMDSSILFEDFKQHLDIENNSRILFSGKFGIGKTTYLNEFFDFNKDDYEVFHLYPINYQVSSNEDIMELIKYDILVDLIKNNKNIFKNDNNNDVSLITYIKNKLSIKSSLKFAINNIVEPVMSISGNGYLGNILGRSLNDMIKFDEGFQKFQKGDKGSIDEFLKENNDESDLIGQIIKSKIVEISNHKQSVLVIDDLDRMDPEHIFRILNVFSAHFESRGTEAKNKFGFDKIVLVADFNNLKSMFHHKYGKETDASGYFDKFFTTHVYEFENIKIIDKFLMTAINSYKTYDDLLLKENTIYKTLLYEVLRDALRTHRINLRSLLKYTKCELPSIKQFQDGTERAGFIFNFNSIVQSLVLILGSKENAINVLNKIKESLLRKEKSNFFDKNQVFISTVVYILPLFTDVYSVNGSNIHICGDIVVDLSKKNVEIKKSGNYITIRKFYYELLIAYIEKGLYKK